MASEISRIDKVLVDLQGENPGTARNRRAAHGLSVVAGDDVASSAVLQLALFTAVNVGAKCFAGALEVHASPATLSAPCLTPLVNAKTVGDAIVRLGAKVARMEQPEGGRAHLVLGRAAEARGALRVTFDGWMFAIGPAAALPRLQERPYCPLAAIAAAAFGVGEIFADFAGLSVMATRRVISLSLWRPDLPIDHPDALGEPLLELPHSVAVFGLGHLGQAYLWAWASLPWSRSADVLVMLCDFDKLEPPNLETGAIASTELVGRLKTRMAAAWLENLGFDTRLIERKLDRAFRRTGDDPAIALSGVDDNWARQWLAEAEFPAMFDSGLGGEAANFDTIAFHAWPNRRAPGELWPIESEAEREDRRARQEHLAATNPGYLSVADDDCGRLLMAGKSVSVPFIGAIASTIVLAEMLKRVNGGPVFSDHKLRACSLGASRPLPFLERARAAPIAGLKTQAARA